MKLNFSHGQEMANRLVFRSDHKFRNGASTYENMREKEFCVAPFLSTPGN